jgi:ABC-type multidrug transport system fused ATPase/permease subunit
MLRFLGGHRRRLIGACLAIQLGNWLQLAFAIGAGCLVDGTLGLSDRGGNFWTERLRPWLKIENINFIGGALAALMVIVVITRYFELAWFHELGERAIARLRETLFAQLVRFPMAFYSRHRVGDLASRLLTDLAQLQENWVSDLRQVQTHGTIVVGSVVLMAFTSLKLTMALTVVAPITIIGGFLIGKQIRRGSAHTQARLGDAAVILEETLQGIQHVKVNAAETWETERYRRSLLAALKPAIRAAQHRALFICVVAFVLLAAWVFLMWQGSRLIEVRPGHPRELSPGAFNTFMFLVFYAMSSAGTLAEVFSRMPRAVASAERVSELLDESSEPADEAEGSHLPRLRGEVAFQDVQFSYPSRSDQPVLRGVTLEVPAGEKVALVGSSGAGKSTLASLVCRLFEPTSGFVLIDGRPATDYPLHWLRSQTAFVPQEIILFGGSIGENIAYGRPDTPIHEIRAAAAKARALEFIDAMPDGLDTLVGDRGSRLSGGQRQRLALARAILRDPAILILDEATSALDSQNESRIQEALEEVMQGRTTFIIAHRLSTVRRVDRIVVLDAGRVVETGSHSELYARGGAYRDLCDHQYFDPEPEVAATTEAAT